MDDPLGPHHGVAPVQLVLPQRHRLLRAAPDRPGRRVEPHRLAQHHLQVGQSLRVSHRRRRAPEHRIQLFVERRLDSRVLRQEIEGPRERHGGGLVSSQQDRHRLVAQLPVAHRARAAFVVARQEEHAEQIAAVPSVFPVLGDEPIDDLVKLAPGPGEAQGRRDGHVQEQPPERHARRLHFKPAPDRNRHSQLRRRQRRQHPLRPESSSVREPR